MASAQPSDGLNESAKEERKVVATCNTVLSIAISTMQVRRQMTCNLSTDPERARRKGYHAASESRFLSLGRYSFVDAFPEPDVGLHVPRVEEDLHIRCELDRPYFDVSSTVPYGGARRTEPSKS